MVAFDGYEAWIEVEGVRAFEYGVKIDGRNVSCTIESREGAEFTVHFRDTHLPPQWLAKQVAFIADGQVADKLCYSEYRNDSETASRGFWVTERDLLPYRFAAVALTDEDERATATENDFKAAGTVSVEIRRLRPGSSRPDSAGQRFERPKQAVYHEQSKKAQSAHAVGVGAARRAPRARGEPVLVDLIDKWRLPAWIKFSFAYKRRDQLEAAGLIPPRAAAVAPIAQPAAVTDNAPPSTAAATPATEAGPSRKRTIDLNTEDVKPKKVKAEPATVDLTDPPSPRGRDRPIVLDDD